jgi:hypothetical protein
MSDIQGMLVRLAGHRIGKVGDAGGSDGDLGGLTKIGAAILLASALSALNMAVFAWVLGAEVSPAVRMAIAVAGASAGFALVLTIDRAAVYFSDTAVRMGWPAMAGYLFARVVLILCIGSFTSQAVMPILLESELNAQALKMRESSDALRSATLTERFGVKDKEAESQRRADEAKRADEATRTLPSDIAHRLAGVRACWADYEARKRALLLEDLDPAELSMRLAGKFTACRQQQVSATAERDRYAEQARLALAQARAANVAAGLALSASEGEVRDRSKQAAGIEAKAYNPRSAEVLWALLRESGGARMKWALLTVLQVTLELLPMLLKLNAGQSTLGRRIGVNREIAARRLDRSLAEQEEDDAMFNAVKALSAQSAVGLEQSAEARRMMDAELLRVFASVAPIESIDSLLGTLAQRQESVDETLRRYPRHANLVSSAWQSALQRAAEAAAGAPSAART